MVKIGNEELLGCYTLLIPENSTARISLDVKGWKGQVLFLVEIMEAVGFNQQQSRLASLYLSSSSCAERA